MNYTENYQLPQWIESDRVLMEDFNAANLKVDQALLGLEEKSPFVRLKEVTVPSETRDVTLNISGIDWGAYQYVLLDADLKGAGDCELRLNSSTEYWYMRLTDTAGSGKGFAYTGIPHHLWVRFFVGKNAASPAMCVSLGSYFCYCAKGPAYQDITTIQLMTTYEGYYISSGAKLTFWGVK